MLGAEKRLSAEHPLLVAAEQEARVARDSARDNLREIKAKGEVFFLPTITSDSFFFSACSGSSCFSGRNTSPFRKVPSREVTEISFFVSHGSTCYLLAIWEIRILESQ